MRKIRCPNCGSFEVTDLFRQAQWISFPLFLLIIPIMCLAGNGSNPDTKLQWGLFIGVIVLTLLIASPFKNKYRCKNCSCEWKQSK